jgi:hypothetical protein
MSETVLLVPDFAHAYGLVLAAQLARAIEAAGARSVLLAPEQNGGWLPPGLTIESFRDRVARATHRAARRHGAQRVVSLGTAGSWIVPERAIRTIVLLRTSTTETPGRVHSRWQRSLARFASRRLFSGWVSLVTDPEERVFLRSRFALFPPITTLTYETPAPAAPEGVLVLEDRLEEKTELLSALREELGASHVTTVGAHGDLPLAPLAPLLARARLLVAPPLLEPVLEAAALGTPVLIPARSHAAQRRARYLERRLSGTVVVDSLAAALALEPDRVDGAAAREAERETLAALARAVLA